jgi:hypothetical protein
LRHQDIGRFDTGTPSAALQAGQAFHNGERVDSNDYTEPGSVSWHPPSVMPLAGSTDMFRIAAAVRNPRVPNDNDSGSDWAGPQLARTGTVNTAGIYQRLEISSGAQDRREFCGMS